MVETQSNHFTIWRLDKAKFPPGFTVVRFLARLAIAFCRKHSVVPYPGTHSGSLDTFIWKVASFQVEPQCNEFIPFSLWVSDLKSLIGNEQFTPV